MVKRPAFWLVMLLCLAASPAQAEPDFFGVKMKSEDFARDLAVRENNHVPDFSNDRPGIDRRIYAHGYASTFFGRGRGLRITVFNHSDKEMATERLFRECTVITREGRRYDRMQTEMQFRRDVLKPGQEATFNMIFPGLDLNRADIAMIIFSFDLGRTNLFLFPMNPPVERLVETKPAPQKAAAVPAPSKKMSVEKKPEPPKKEVVVQEKKAQEPKGPHCVTPVTMVQSVFGGLGRAIGTIGRRSPPAPKKVPAPEAQAPTVAVLKVESVKKNRDSAIPPPSESAQVIDTTEYHFSPDFKKKVAEGEKQVKETVFVDRPWSLADPGKASVRTPEDYPLPQGAPPRAKATVALVNTTHGFIVFNAGAEDGVKENGLVSVIRDGRRIGKAMVRKVREKVSAAAILPEWQTKTAIKAGDQVELS